MRHYSHAFPLDDLDVADELDQVLNGTAVGRCEPRQCIGEKADDELEFDRHAQATNRYGALASARGQEVTDKRSPYRTVSVKPHGRVLLRASHGPATSTRIRGSRERVKAGIARAEKWE